VIECSIRPRPDRSGVKLGESLTRASVDEVPDDDHGGADLGDPDSHAVEPRIQDIGDVVPLAGVGSAMKARWHQSSVAATPIPL
jgi:hypothetical protein